jgi:hypothetical protein
MGRHPVAVVISHITYARTMKVYYSRFSFGGLHGEHVVATCIRKTGTIPAVDLGPRETMLEVTTSRVMAADRPYGEFY